MSASVTMTDTAAGTGPWAVGGRWMLGFLGFPIGGLLAISTVGSVDSTATALAAGVLTGTVLGLAQALASRALPAVLWIAATAAGTATGLALGATLVDFDTTLGPLALQGAVTGAVVGVAQAMVLAHDDWLPRSAVAAWAPFLAACWALGWTITASAGVDVERQYTVFGATGAVAVTALTVVLPLRLRTRPVSPNTTATAIV